MKTDNLTDRTVDKNVGRRQAGSYGRPGKERHAVANKASRNRAKVNLRYVMPLNCS
jgi:hypothetical protein